MDLMDKAGASLEKLLQKWAIPLKSHPAECMMQYLKLLEKWNSKLNLTASSDWNSIYFLFEEAIWAGRYYGDSVSSHLDLGSGAGFPAIILNILNPAATFELVESREKRAIFLETVLLELGFRQSKVFNCRIEDYLHRCEKGSWDCISWKGIKLNGECLRLLSRTCSKESQLWMFHGNALAVENPSDLMQFFDLHQREGFPGKKAWYLSMFHMKQGPNAASSYPT
jgi:16S rRNA (guanine(527)-N(7))-methyltransferase RsmG